MPVSINDMIQEIILIEETKASVYFYEYVSSSPFYFRPFEHFLRYVVKWAFSHHPIGYAVLGGIFLSGVSFCMLMVMSPTTKRQYGIALIGMAILLGHHAMGGSLEFNMVISNLFTMFLFTLLMWSLFAAPNSSNLIIIPVVILGLLTKELGLLLVGLVVLVRVLGISKIKLGTTLITLGLGIIYVAYKIITILKGDGFTFYGPGEVNYLNSLLNMVATTTNILTSFPKEANFSLFPLLTGMSYPKWQYVHLLGSLAVTLLIIIATIPQQVTTLVRPARYRSMTFLFLILIALTSCLAFFYTRDRHGAMVLPMLVYLFYLGANHLAEIVPTHGLVRYVAVGIVCLIAIPWGMRMAGTAFYIREASSGIRMDWYQQGPHRPAVQYHASGAGQAIVALYYGYATEGRAPRVWLDRSWIKEWLGGNDAVVR